MASDQSKSEEREKQAAQMKLRRALDDAYGSLEGQRTTQSFLAFSFEEAMSNQIERISGASSRLRPNELDRVERIRSNLVTAVEAIKKIPPEAFMATVDGRDVNS